MKKMTILMLTVLAVGLSSAVFAASSNAQDNSAPECPKCLDGSNCSKILNKRNRYDEDGAQKRRMYPRFLHSNIKPKVVNCECLCHADSKDGKTSAHGFSESYSA